MPKQWSSRFEFFEAAEISTGSGRDVAGGRGTPETLKFKERAAKIWA